MNNHQQSGAALLVALIMLLISTVIGMASIRSTTLSERMTSNMYDRSLAYQGAEAALRAGEAALEAGTVTPVDCTSTSAVRCPPTPEGTFDASSTTGWVSVASGFYVNEDLIPTAPEFYLEKMGEIGGTDEFGISDSANCANYAGCDETAPSAALYRITGRSVIKEDGNAGRSVVALQITVKQNL